MLPVITTLPRITQLTPTETTMVVATDAHGITVTSIPILPIGITMLPTTGTMLLVSTVFQSPIRVFTPTTTTTVFVTVAHGITITSTSLIPVGSLTEQSTGIPLPADTTLSLT